MSDRKRISIPPSYPVGAIFGRKSANLRRLRCESGGAYISVNDQERYVELSGESAAVAAAEALLQEQFSSRDVVGYPHPQQAHILLDCALFSGPAVFKPLSHAVGDVAGAAPAFDSVKTFFSLGKQLFYTHRGGTSLGAMGPLSFAELQALKVGRNIKCVFSNHCSQAGCVALMDYLFQELHFRLLPPKSSVSVHLVRRRAYTSVRCSYAQLKGGELQLRKLRSGQQKPFFCSLVHADDYADVRVRLVANRKLFKAGGSLAHESHGPTLEAARACRLDPSGGGGLLLPERFHRDFEVDGVREKEREAFEGRIQVRADGSIQPAEAGGGGVRVRVSVERVRDHSSGSTHLEIFTQCMEALLNLKPGNCNASAGQASAPAGAAAGGQAGEGGQGGEVAPMEGSGAAGQGCSLSGGSKKRKKEEETTEGLDAAECGEQRERLIEAMLAFSQRIRVLF